MARTRKRKWLIAVALAAIVVAVLVVRESEPKIPDGSWLTIDIDGAYVEAPPESLLSRLIEERKVLLTLLENLDKATHDHRIAGVLVRIGTLETGWAQASEIRDALVAVKTAGKRVVAFMRGANPSANLEYYLASVADHVYVAPGGEPMLTGLSASFYYLGGLWEKTDIGMQVEQMREYKSFGDMLSRKQMTPANREMANWILDSLNGEFLGALADGRGMSPEQVRSIIDACPANPDAFVQAGLADGVLFADQVEDEIGAGKPPKLVDEDDYAKVDAESVGIGGGSKIAVVYAAGTIMPGKGGGRSLFGVTVGSDTLSKAFHDAADDSDVSAIVFRVDSPGGSATASDEVWRSIRQARARKPVIASLADTAASGGYYMAVAADHIVADATTITGSIGVVAFKPNISGLLADGGVATEALSRGRYARLFDLTKTLDKDERALLHKQIEHTYDLFVGRVAEGRGMKPEQVDKIGGGRVWTGRQALDLGLIDEIGGLDAAVRAAAHQAGIEDAQTVELVFYPKPEGLLERLSSLRKAQATALLPAAWERHIEQIGAQALLGAGVHALTSAVLTVR
jgi:protease IV